MSIVVPGVWSDIVWHSTHGFVVVTSVPGMVSAIPIDTPWTPLWSTVMPGNLYLIYLRATVWNDEVVAVGQGEADKAMLARASGLSQVAPVVAAQNGALAVVEDDQLVLYVQVSGRQYVRQVYGQPWAAPQDNPIGLTSQGWLDFDPSRGGLVWTDPNSVVTIDGVKMIKPMQRGDGWVGQNPKPFDTLRAIGTVTGVAYQLDPIAGGPLPHIAWDGAGQWAVAATMSGAHVRVDVSPFPPPPTAAFAFTHPVCVGPFFPSKQSPGRVCVVANATDWRTVTPDGSQVVATPNSLDVAVPPTDRLFGVYTEQHAFAEGLTCARRHETRLVAVEDSKGLFSMDLGRLKPWDLPGVECYWYKAHGESLDDAETRWRSVLSDLMARWPHDAAVVMQSYMMGLPPTNALTEADVMAMLPRMVSVANAYPRLKLVLPFADNPSRLDGVHASVVALTTAGAGPMPVFIPVDGGPPPIPPIPPQPPVTVPQGGAISMSDIQSIMHHYGKCPVPDAGLTAYYANAIRTLVWSAQPDGSLGTRPTDAIGPYEKFKENGQVATANSAGTLNDYLAIDVSGLHG